MKHIFFLLGFIFLTHPYLACADELPITFRQGDDGQVDMSIALSKGASYSLGADADITNITINSKKTIDQKKLEKLLPKGFSILQITPLNETINLKLKTSGYILESHAREKHGVFIEYKPSKSMSSPQTKDANITVQQKEDFGRTKNTSGGKPPLPPQKNAVPTAQTNDKDTVQPGTVPIPRTSGLLEITGTNEKSQLIFTFPEARSMAAFERDGYFWIVFNHPYPVEVKGTLLRSFGKLEQRLDSSMVVFEIDRSPDTLASISKKGDQWIVTLSLSRIVNEKLNRSDLKGELKYTDEQRPFYEIKTNHSNLSYTFTDPRRGDQVILCPLDEEGRRFEAAVYFADFHIASSLQGVVILPQAPELQVGFTDESIQIKRLQGLNVSSRRDREKSRISHEDAKYLDFKKWVRLGESYNDIRMQLEREIANSSQSTRIKAYYNLIRFNLSRGYGVEALGLLRVLSDDIPGLIHDPQFLALRSVAYFLSNKAGLALHDLTSRELDSIRETRLWKGATLNTLGQTGAGTELFADNYQQINELPPYLKVLMALNGSMAALKEDEVGLAAKLEAIMASTPIPTTQKQDYELLRAFLAEEQKEPNQAQTILTHVAEGHDGKSAALAEIELVHRDLNSAVIDIREAIKRLEALRYSWRGSEIEVRILNDLSQLYLDSRNFRKALSTMAIALKYHPDSPESGDMQKSMVQIFKELFADESHHTISPVTAISLYESFKNLTPPGPDGDEIIVGLARNLERLDLFDQAVSALRSRYESSETFNPKLVLEYAIALLATNKSGEALKVIETADKQKLSSDERGKLLYLKVKAMANVGMFDAALKLLQGDDSDIASRMRAGLYWKAEKWAKAADSLWAILDKQKEKEKDPELLMSYALMLYKAQDFPRLKEIRQKYIKQVEGTKFKEPFMVFTSQNLASTPSLDQLNLHLAQVGDFEVLLEAKAK